ncbi:MAG: type II secretion system protein [Deltaproteobacteria bacterium]|nr:type II secretion system protein [Deltaproteobacteria bacterium]
MLTDPAGCAKSARAIAQDRSGGFTLLELIVVMALMGIVFFFAIPRFEGSPFFDDAKKSGRWLIGKVQALREESLRTRRQQTLHIDLETGRIWNTTEAMSLEEIDRAVRRAQLLPGGGRIVGVEFPGKSRASTGRAEIRFYRDGHSEKVLIHLRHGDAFSSFLLEPFLSQVKVFDTLVGFEDLR